MLLPVMKVIKRNLKANIFPLEWYDAAPANSLVYVLPGLFLFIYIIYLLLVYIQDF